MNFASVISCAGFLLLLAACSQQGTEQPETPTVSAEKATLSAEERDGTVTTVISDSPADIALTIYTDDLALVTERRLVNLPSGPSVIRFEGVSDMMIPQSAILREFTGFTLERNFDFDLITPGALFDDATGSTVTLIRTNPYTGEAVEQEAKVVSGGNGVVLEIDGEYEALDCAGIPEKAAFDRVPDGLNPQPTLSIEVSADEAGEQEVILSYLASGFGWAADYRLDLNEDKRSGKLVGWLTVYNETEISIRDASTAVIAGELQRLWQTAPEGGVAKGFAARCWPRGSSKTGVRYDPPAPPPVARSEMAFARAVPGEAEMMQDSIIVTGSRQRKAELEEFGDYKLYRIPEPTTVAAYQEKQLLFLDAPAVELEKIHTFSLYSPDSFGEFMPATVSYHLDNSREGKLGLPLPEGTMRVMTNGRNGLFYLGEDSVENLAVDLPAEFDIATAADVQMQSRFLNQSSRRLQNGRYEQIAAVEHTFFNASPEEVMIELKVGEEFYTPIRISKETLMRDFSSDTPKWRFTLPPESSKAISYTATWIN